ncbi:MAG: class I SAM-dependent methyltransferase [Treponema sp.]|nr:class I SAM-dependent methyltransferase [Treponema sp.]
MRENYYAESLNARKLFQVYQTKHLRVKQYFDAEISFVRNRLQGTEHVLELGAGYGRIMKELSPHCATITGIDISKDTVEFGNAYLSGVPNARLLVMDAHDLKFSEPFDVVLCLQNALSAMKTQPLEYVKKMTALLSPGGKIFISSYSEKFWEYRKAWFFEQAEKGLVGEIDVKQTRDGVIACKDGFRSITHSPQDMDLIGKTCGINYEITEVDESSIFLIITNTKG